MPRVRALPLAGYPRCDVRTLVAVATQWELLAHETIFQLLGAQPGLGRTRIARRPARVLGTGLHVFAPDTPDVLLLLETGVAVGVQREFQVAGLYGTSGGGTQG